MNGEKLIDRLAKSRHGKKILDEVEASERADAEWESAAAELARLRAERPKLLQTLQAKIDKANADVRNARAALRQAEERSGEAAHAWHAEFFNLEKKIAGCEARCYRNAPASVLDELAGLKDDLRNNMDQASSIGIVQSVDLPRRKVSYDKSAVIEHLNRRKQIQRDIEATEARILSGTT